MHVKSGNYFLGKNPSLVINTATTDTTKQRKESNLLTCNNDWPGSTTKEHKIQNSVPETQKDG